MVANTMTKTQKNFCFCTLALGHQYRMMAQELAKDLEKYSPGTLIYIFTDNPINFKEQQNVVAFKHYQQGIQRCSNDRRLILKRVLLDFPIAIHIDADTKITGALPTQIDCSPGITGLNENLVTHLKKNRPQNWEIIKTIANKLEIPLDKAQWIGESLYIVARDGGKEEEFFRLWGLIASYVELKGMHGGDGNLMGLAACKIGWNVEANQTWQTINQLTQHFDASHSVKRNQWQQLQRRVSYHYRLNKWRLLALKDFDFYYR